MKSREILKQMGLWRAAKISGAHTTPPCTPLGGGRVGRRPWAGAAGPGSISCTRAGRCARGSGTGCCPALALLPPPSHHSLNLKIPVPLADVWDPGAPRSPRAPNCNAPLDGRLSPDTKTLIRPLWPGKGNELERPVIWKGLSLLAGSPGDMGRREGWVVGAALLSWSRCCH